MFFVKVRSEMLRMCLRLTDTVTKVRFRAENVDLLMTTIAVLITAIIIVHMMTMMIVLVTTMIVVSTETFIAAALLMFLASFGPVSPVSRGGYIEWCSRVATE